MFGRLIVVDWPKQVIKCKGGNDEQPVGIWNHTFAGVNIDVLVRVSEFDLRNKECCKDA